ncbi:MAG: hypothetical protein PHO56_01800 [Patescibacteria group bacterium]|nr:hypothetical protein [Patescibacteria group bacterium]
MKSKIIIEELFYFLSASLAVFFPMELFWPRIVLAYLNLNWLVLLWVIAGVAVLILPREDK